MRSGFPPGGRPPAPAMVSTGCAVLFVGLSVWVERAGVVPGETGLLDEIERVVPDRADTALVRLADVTDTGPLMAVGAIVAAQAVLRRRWRAALVVIVAVAIVAVVNPILKELFARPRPTVRAVPGSVSEFSYPSGHAANSAAVLGAALLVAHSAGARRAIAAVGGAAALVVATGQLAIGAHHPSDVVAAWLWVGAWIAALGAYTARHR